MTIRILTITLGLGLAGSVLAEGTVPTSVLRHTTLTDLARAGDRVVAVGDRGTVLFSDDDGLQWQRATTPTGVLLTAVCFANDRQGWAVGHDATILATSDGGRSWQLQHQDVGDVIEEVSDDDLDDEDWDDEDWDENSPAEAAAGAPLLDVQCLSARSATAVGAYGLRLETADGGLHWQPSSETLPDAEGWHLYQHVLQAGGPDYLVGEKGSLYRRDGVGHWEPLESPYDGTFFGGLASRHHGLLVFGLQGNLWRSVDSGISWQRVALPIRSGINSGLLLERGRVALVGNAGVLLESRDEGRSFTLRHLPGRPNLSAVLARRDGGYLVAGVGGIHIVAAQESQP
ncbi:WD40/YVTN/BNR-like repeat-containing protein [Isoalcanivorax beigongshangi]|uniref:WD40/YVTN/BNR-like repeat-containing protein n=1 Tax=Isoalcanivorax beigongshangi TaxID=3238810 RepID=A0ABV4AJ01_9GAMM